MNTIAMIENEKKEGKQWIVEWLFLLLESTDALGSRVSPTI